LRSVVGFEKVKFFRPGYAIEYDYFPPTQLKHTLETKLVEGLYFAGQINGTTGYEEAASQGLMAGINAALKVQEREPFILKRDEAYIGVLIDDLITKGTEEPYRMFTSRAEFRTLLRQDNADQRLTPKGYDIGLASEERLKRMEYKFNESDKLVTYFKETSISPEEANPVLETKGSALMTQSDKMFKVFSRPQIELEDIVLFDKVKQYIQNEKLDQEVVEQAEIQVKYSGYIEKERNNADKLKRLEDLVIPQNFDYDKIKSMSIEAKEKLKKIRPVTVSQASRISGVSPSDVSVLLIYMGR
jgi:tRNA uridine 5-carboxymethylaminomethyl modification enzyme